VRHLPRTGTGWDLAESANFRVFHKANVDLAEKTIQVAEQTRSHLMRKWFGGKSDFWVLKCDLYLYPTAQDYGQATGQFQAPGHSTLKLESGRLIVRRIELHGDNAANMLQAVLPHETTHVLLADQFGGYLLPRWADEGMAVLTEPREKVERHLANLHKCRQDGLLFRLKDLVEQTYQPQQEGYPEPRRIGAFYAQSVSLVDFLTRRPEGPHEFVLFLHDGFRYGYEKSLQRHYGYRDFAELERQWTEEVFGQRANPRAAAVSAR
jgi:hypothetical protein